MLDIYVRDPSATPTSTAAAFPQRNYTIAPADAWSERIEAQGFAPPVWVNAAGASLGSAQLIADPPSEHGDARAAARGVRHGRARAGCSRVALTGQDGFSSDQARAFAATPQAFTFGVCAPAARNPICSVDPNTVPKVMDTITPSGCRQATELNPLNGPVQLQGVTVP